MAAWTFRVVEEPGAIDPVLRTPPGVFTLSAWVIDPLFFTVIEIVPAFATDSVAGMILNSLSASAGPALAELDADDRMLDELDELDDELEDPQPAMRSATAIVLKQENFRMPRPTPRREETFPAETRLESP